MASVHDVAAYILQQRGQMSTFKLQKLAYYSQAWHLVWDDEPLFNSRIEAWANGPVVRELYLVHRGRYQMAEWPEGRGDAAQLTTDERETIDAVLEGYGALSGRQLSHLTHSESPWRDARGDLGPTERSTEPITPAAMQAYYTALDTADEARPVSSIDWSALGE